MKNRIATAALIIATFAFAGYATEPAHACGKSDKAACCKTESCCKDGADCCKSGACDHSKCKTQSCCKKGCDRGAAKS